jgi:hypothetical protein
MKKDKKFTANGEKINQNISYKKNIKSIEKTVNEK